MSSMKSACSSRHSSTGSVRAQLRARAAATKYRAEAEADLAAAEKFQASKEQEALDARLQRRNVELNIAAKEAKIEASEFEHSLHSDDYDDFSSKDFTSNDRVEHYLLDKRTTLPTSVPITVSTSLPEALPTLVQDFPVTTSVSKTRVLDQILEHDMFSRAHSSIPSTLFPVHGISNFQMPNPSDMVRTTAESRLRTPVCTVTSSQQVTMPGNVGKNSGHSLIDFLDNYTTPVNSLPKTEPTVSYVHTRGGTCVPPPPPGFMGHSSILTPSRTPGHVQSQMSDAFESILQDCVQTNLQVAETLARSQLPRIDYEKFSGDPANYVSWKRTALAQLSLPMSSTERLVRLSKMVDKDPSDIVKQYSDRFPSQPKLAYEKAWQVLDHRYGRSCVIADALLTKLNNFKKFSESDFESLQRFSDLCASVSLQIESLPGLKVLDYPLYLKPISGRLPSVFQRKWTDKAFRILKAQKANETYSPDSVTRDYPTFSEFSQFLEDMAEKNCDPNLRPYFEENGKAGGNGKISKHARYQDSKGPKPDLKGQSKDFRNPDVKRSEGQSKDWRDTNLKRKFCPVHPDLPDQRAHRFAKCKKFQYMSTSEQVELLKSGAKDYCRSCLELGHKSNCDADMKCEKCDKRHFSFLHDACTQLRGTDRTPHSYSGQASSKDCSDFLSTAICPAQRTYCRSLGDGELVPITILHDSGSNISLVTTDICEKLQFRKISDSTVMLNVEVLGGDTISTGAHRYQIPLHDEEGKLLTSISAYAIERIGSDLPTVDLTDACRIFGLSSSQCEIAYPSGPVHILLGVDNAHATPSTVSRVDGMILAQSIMGRVIYGRHDSFGNASSEIASYKVTIRPNELRMDLVPSLFATDVLGISCTPKCGACSCKQCPADDAPHTLQERYEYEQIKSSMTLDNGVVTASYPYVRDPAQLPDNYELALKRLRQTERSLSRDPVRAGKYQEQLDDMIARGVMRNLTPEEENAWTGPVQYLPHNDVLKPGSESTPTRLVFDPSAQYKGKAVNQFWGRGPCLMNDSIGILLRFREHPAAFAGDISKMYWCVHTRPLEWHLHRILWRNMDVSRPPDKYIIVRNSFGSGPAGTVAIAALNFLAERREEEFPDAAHVIKRQAFVDDIIDSTPTVADAERLTGEIDQILSDGSFKIKKWTIVNSSSEPPARGSAELAKSDSVLGIAWNTTDDEFYFVPRLNFSKKRKKVRQGPDLTPGQIRDRTIVPSLTKKSILSQVNSLYDPLGLLSPFLVELKFGIAKLWRLKQQLDWDTSIPDDHDEHWRHLFELFFAISKLRFPRLLRPSTAVEPPILLAFSDSSMMSYCAVIYVRWSLTDGSVFARLVTAKTRIWPIEPDDYLSVARGELMGILLSKRLVATVLKESRLQFDEIIYVSDSEIALAQIRINSHEFGVWTGSRVAEIRKGTDLSQFWFARSADNPCADLCSRGTTDFSLLDHDSVWQRGPPWAYQPRTDWPLIQHVKTTQPLPDLRAESLARRTLIATQPPPDPATSGEALKPVTAPLIRPIPCVVFKAVQTLGESAASTEFDSSTISPRLSLAEFTSSQEDFIASLFDLSRHDDFNLWLATTARVLHACSWKPGSGSFFSRLVEPDVVPSAERETARRFWIRQAQRPLKIDIKSGKYASLTPFLDDHGIYRINGRSRTTSSYQPIFLPSHHPVSRLIVIAIHRRCHDGRSATASRSRAEYHILKIRRLAAKVRADCQLCTLKEKRLLKVLMAPLPVARLEPCYPFEHTSCDLFGPVPVKLEGRVTRNKSFNDDKLKAYGVLFACLATRAVHLGIMQGQDTDAFLLAHRRFVAIRGQPKTMYSDNGGQLVAADNELREMVANWDIDRLRRFGAENSMTWTFTSPGSPWQNGITEALIRSVKRSLQVVLPPRTLTILELQTIFTEVAELLNERPIGIGSKHFTGDDFDSETNSYLCPNQLLLGRSSIRVPSGPFSQVQVSHANRFLANQTMVTEWWKRWCSDYLPSLVSQNKWYRSDRHTKIGDIVQVRDLNPIRGDWNIAEVIDVKSNADKIPRNVLLRYKNVHPGKDYKTIPFRTQWRDVKNLSLLLPVEGRSDLNPSATPFVPNSDSV